MRSMRRGKSAWMIVLGLAASAAASADTTYSYTGATFGTADPPYTTSDRLTGTFTLAAPLASFTPLTDISGLLTDFSFGDGVQTRTPADTAVCAFEVATDGAGHIVAWNVNLRELPFTTGNPQRTVDSTTLDDLVGIGPANTDACGMIIHTAAATSSASGTWTDPLPPGTPTTYTYTGAPFTSADPPFAIGDRLTGSVLLADPLPPFLPPTDIAHALDSFSFSDGVQTRTPANSEVCAFEVATDGAGHIVAWTVNLRELPFTTGNPQLTVDSTALDDLVGIGPANTDVCGMVIPTAAATSSASGTWTDLLPPVVPASYGYLGQPFTFFEPPYTVANRLTGGIVVAGTLPANLPLTDITATLLDYNFTDGVQARTAADSEVCVFAVGTDAAGAIVQWQLLLRQAVAGPGPQQTIDSSSVGPSATDLGGTGISGGGLCGDITPVSPFGSNFDRPGTWTGNLRTLDIPTLSGTAATLLAALLALAALAAIRRTR